MFGPNFHLGILVDTIIEVKPSSVALGAHHYVQLSNCQILEQVDPMDLDSIKMFIPVGSAVPSSCKQALKAKFRNLEVLP